MLTLLQKMSSELFPPGGFDTLDVGWPVITFPQFMFLPFANALLEIGSGRSSTLDTSHGLL